VTVHVASAEAYVPVIEIVPDPLFVETPPPPSAFFPAGQVAVAVFGLVPSLAVAVPVTR